jgi:hypothetical protein
MRALRGIGGAIEALVAIPFTILVFYLAYLIVAWSWGLLLEAAGVAVLGAILLSIAVNAEEARTRPIRPGKSIALAIVGQAGRGLATSAFAIAVGLVLTAIFQGVALSGSDNLYARDVMEFEESILSAKVWLDTVLGLDVLAGILVLAVALSLLLPLKSLVERALSVRRVLSFVYIVLLTLTSFTFFAGLALRPYELVLREDLRSKTAFAFQDQDMDARKSLVAVAWILDELNDPAATPIPPDLVERLRGHLKRSPYDDEVDTAAWRIAGFDTVMYFTDDDGRRLERFKTEADIHAQDDIASDAAAVDGFKSLHAFVASLFGDTFAGFKAETGPQAAHYLRVLHTVQPPGQPRPATWRESALAQARIAALEILSSALADKIGGAITSEEFRRHFVGELVQAVVAPLWDVALPLDIKDVASARTFVSNQRLDRAPLDWDKLADLAPLPAEQAAVAVTPDANAGPTTGPGSTSTFAVPMQLPSWQNFGSATTFVVLPPVGAPEVYTRPVARFR